MWGRVLSLLTSSLDIEVPEVSHTASDCYGGDHHHHHHHRHHHVIIAIIITTTIIIIITTIVIIIIIIIMIKHLQGQEAAAHPGWLSACSTPCDDIITKVQQNYGKLTGITRFVTPGDEGGQGAGGGGAPL
jgi:hypothetical protein